MRSCSAHSCSGGIELLFFIVDSRLPTSHSYCHGIGTGELDIVFIVLDAPDHGAGYVHRLGRTGAGRQGWGIISIEPSEKTNAMEIVSALKKSKSHNTLT